MKTVQIKNIGNEPLAFTWFPVIEPGQTIEVTKEQSQKLLLNESVQLIESEKKQKAAESFKAVE